MPGPARRHRGLYWAAVLISVLTVAGGSVVAYQAYQDTAGPDGAVKGYFAALENSDAAKALAYGDLPKGPHTLLTATVLREQQRIAPIRDVRIVAVQRHGSAATVTVNYRLGFASGVQAVTDSVLVQHRGSSWALAKTAVPTAIHLTQALERASVVGTSVPQGDTLLFPGALPIRFDTPYLQLAAGSGNSVAFVSGNQLAPNVEISRAGRTAVAAALGSALTACFGAGTKSLTCPLPSAEFVPGTLTGRLDGSLADAMRVDVGTTSAGVFDVSGTVGFVGTYRKLDFNNVASTQRGTVQIPLNATTYVQALKLQWAAPQ